MSVETNINNDVTGYYSNGIITGSTSTATETNTHSVGSSTFTETATNSIFTQENGNTFTGYYSRTIRYDNSTLNDSDHGTDAAGSFSVTKSWEGSTLERWEGQGGEGAHIFT